MFADPQTVTVGGTPYTLVKVNQDQYSSEYRFRDTTFECILRLRNSSYTDKKRGVRVDRHNAELICTIFPVAPSTLSTIRKQYLVFEHQEGDALTGAVAWATGLCALLTASSAAALTKLTNFES